jgi:hypothetical protein
MDDMDLGRLRESLQQVESDLRSGMRALHEGTCSRADRLLRELGEELTILHPRSRQVVRARLLEVTLGYEEELLFRLVWRDEGGPSHQLTLNLGELMASVQGAAG